MQTNQQLKDCRGRDQVSERRRQRLGKTCLLGLFHSLLVPVLGWHLTQHLPASVHSTPQLLREG